MADTSQSSAAPRIIENEHGPIAPSQSKLITSSDPLSGVLDRSWVSNAFMIPDAAFTDAETKINRYWTTAAMKFTDTQLGGSIGINPRYQFCQYSDVPNTGRVRSRKQVSISDFSGDYGMGRQYSEFIDDAAQRIYMTFGVPQYNSLFQFFARAYESHQMTMARTGRAPSAFYTAGKFIGAGMLVTAFPILSAVILVGKVYNFLFGTAKSKFYSLKPTMHLYWSTVNTLAQAMAVNRGLAPKLLGSDEQQREGKLYVLDDAYLTALSDFMPGIFRDVGFGLKTFDVYAIANRAQRVADVIWREEYEELNADGSNATNWTSYLKKQMTGSGAHGSPITDTQGNPTIGAQVDHAVQSTVLFEKFMNGLAAVEGFFSGQDDTDVGVETDFRADMVDDKGNLKSDSGFAKYGYEFLQQVDAQLHDGALFATFMVNHTGPQSENWSNAVVESELSQKVNGAISTIAEARFSAAEGNVIGGIVKEVAGAVTSTVEGLVSGVTAGLSDTLRGLAGAGYIDIPKHWQSSSFSPTRSNYTIRLATPYGNPISMFMDLDIPMAMLMAGALPRSTGKSSYTAPFLCQIFDRGRCQIRLGMIEALSFTRGTTHLGFNDNGAALGIDVNFSVVDLSSIMHMPVSGGGILDGIDMTMDDDNILQDYIAVLTGQSIENQIYAIPKAKIRFATAALQLSKITSPAYMASAFGSTLAADMWRLFTRKTASVDATGATLAQ